MAENKTKPTDASVEDYLASRANEQQRADCQELMTLFQKVTHQSPRMWGPSIVGYGSYRYTYESGRTGEAPLAGFAVRGRELVLYLDMEGDCTVRTRCASCDGSISSPRAPGRPREPCYGRPCDGDREEYAQDIPPRRTQPIRAFTKARQTDGKRIQRGVRCHQEGELGHAA